MMDHVLHHTFSRAEGDDFMASKTLGWIFLGAIVVVGLAWATQPQRMGRGRRAESERVDEASEDSFPASDPPSYTPETGAQAGATS